MVLYMNTLGADGQRPKTRSWKMSMSLLATTETTQKQKLESSELVNH